MPKLKVISHELNKGIGKAFETGFMNIKTDYVVTIDADLSHNFLVVEELYRNRKKADVVIASMNHERSEFSNASKITQYFENLLSTFGFELSLLSVCIFFGGVMFFNGLAAVATWYATLKIKYSLLVYLLTDTLGQFFRSQFLFFSQGNMGKLLNSFQQEVIKIGDTFGSIAKFFANLLQIFILLIVPIIFSTKLTIVFILATALISLPLWLMRKFAYNLGKANTETANTTTGILHESLSAAKLIMGFGCQEKTVNRYKNSLAEHSRARVKLQTLDGGIANLFLPLGVISVLIELYTA